MKDCIFCKIVSGKVPGVKVYEDKRHLVILDAFPTADYQLLVIPKKHVTSVFSKVPDHVLADIMLVAKKVAKHTDSILGTRSCVIIEGQQVPHLHIKIYPVKSGKYLSDSIRKEFPSKMTDSSILEKQAERIRL